MDYGFVSKDEFARLIEEGAFLEWADVFGHRYGTLWRPIEGALDSGMKVILEIDVQGAAEVRRRRPDAVLVFLAPPSVEELGRRLRARHTESEPELTARLAAAQREMDQSTWFDHVVVNDVVERAAAEVAAIIEAASGDP
jgi:guanylate kinase